MRRKQKTRPRNQPFSKEERQYLCALDVVDSCTEKRISWNRGFIEEAKKLLAEGHPPTEIFRSVGVGPEKIGSKRIERCAARWRKAIERERKENEAKQ